MVRSLKALRETSDDVLIEEHDKLAVSTVGGTAYYVEELGRRELARWAAESQHLALRSHGLAVASFVLATVTMIASIAAVVIALMA